MYGMKFRINKQKTGYIEQTQTLKGRNYLENTMKGVFKIKTKNS